MRRNSLALRTRPLLRSDARTAAEWMVEEWSLPRRSAHTYATLFEDLIDEGRIFGGCIEECPDAGRTWQLAVIGLSAFASEAAIDGYLREPTPFPSLVLLDRVEAGERDVLLDETAIGRDNAGHGLNQITIYYGQVSKDPDDPIWRELLPTSHKLHREVHGGYNLRRVLQDEWTRHEEVFVHAGYRILERFPPGTPAPKGLPPLPASRTLVGLTAEEAAQKLPGSTASFLFEHRPPRLALTSAERRLLSHAASGLTDQQIAAVMNISPNTLKGSWRRIYERCETSAPFILELDGGATGPSGRGPEKRRRVIAYVQDHPEELRPYKAP